MIVIIEIVYWITFVLREFAITALSELLPPPLIIALRFDDWLR